MQYLLKESSTYPKPIKAHLNRFTIKTQINNILDNSCNGGTCYECDNITCKRLHDAETWHMALMFKAIGLKAEIKESV